VSLIGVGHQEAFQVLDNAATVFYSSTYMVLFAIPVVGMKRFSVQAPLWLKLTALSGFLVALLSIGFTIIPIINVQSRFWFAAKIILVVIVFNGLGMALFLRGKGNTVRRAV